MPVNKTMLGCYHCGLPVRANSDYSVTINHQRQPMCCIGCQAVALAIVSGGLENFYRFRTATNVRGDSEKNKTNWEIYNLPDVQNQFVTDYGIEQGTHYKQANLLLENISCAACSWLIETHLKKNSAVKIMNVNVSTHRCTLVWAPAQVLLSDLLQSLEHIGYKPRPATDEQQQAFIKQENRKALFRLGVAGFGTMQAMMVAVGIYTGATDSWLIFLRWLSMLAATPVVFFSAAPFFTAAWRSLKSKQLIMDVPVALAIGLAYIASAWATFTRTGDVYFESVSMFTFFLLLGRYIEQRARHRNRLAFGNLAQLMPLTACCITQQQGVKSSEESSEVAQQIPLAMLRLNDTVFVKTGETFPCDGVVIAGESEAVEALITGESIPVAKKIGDNVIAGTLNSQSALRIRVMAIGSATQLSGIERLAAQAAEEKPKQVIMADKIARFFVARLLVVCVGVFLFWWFKEPSRALWVTLSVLVVTCPCALALAVPAAMSAATANLRARGFLVARGHVLEMLPQITRIMFDKTGTLTHGNFHVTQVQLCSEKKREQVLAIAAALEAGSNHPIASAFKNYQTNVVAQNTKQFMGLGVEGFLHTKQYRLGTAEFSCEIMSEKNKQGNFVRIKNSSSSPQGVQCLRNLQGRWIPCGDDGSDSCKGRKYMSTPDNKNSWLLLSDTEGAVAWFAVADKIRESAQAAIAELQNMGIAVELLSGDKSAAVKNIAQQLNISETISGATPEDKLARLNIAQLSGDNVLMIGDGINDVPVLAGADVSVAMACASDLAQTRADSVLLNNQLTLLPAAIKIAQRTRSIIKQNLIFSLTYNVIALPLAATGHVAPWAAAIGMTMSSLIVVMNALRLNYVIPAGGPVPSQFSQSLDPLRG
jgi:P-type Cu2+ transporter